MNSRRIKVVSFLLIILQTSLFFTSCSSQNVRKLLRNGSVEDIDFKSTYNYESYGNGIIVKVFIKDKEYRLLFDTGAVTAISPRMVKELDLTPVAEEEVFDISTASRNLDFVKIDTVTFNEINFYDTGAAVLDIEAVKDFKCLGIDGFLGANFMRNAIWEVDMKTKEITFTNSIDSINIPENTPHTKFFIGYDGTPAITSYLGEEKLYKTVVDYGYGGGISLFSYDFNNLIDEKPDIKFAKANGGSTMAGVYGDIKTSKSYNVIIDDFNAGDFHAPTSLISFGEFDSRVIGAEFLRNYRVILSWKDRKVWFIENNVPEEKIIFKGHGYGFRLEEGSIFISSIFENSDAEQKGLKIGDEILGVNSADYTKVTDEKWCEIISSTRPDKHRLLVERGTEQITFDLERKVLLEN